MSTSDVLNIHLYYDNQAYNSNDHESDQHINHVNLCSIMINFTYSSLSKKMSATLIFFAKNSWRRHTVETDNAKMTMFSVKFIVWTSMM